MAYGEKMKQTLSFRIRSATAEDVPHLFHLVKKLADYEQLNNEFTATRELFVKFGFGEHSYFNALLAEHQDKSDIKFLGFALYFFTFSTFAGKPTLYLEDLFVLPEYRKQGIGKALLKELARIAIQHDCGRMEWAVLNWNEPAIRFFRSMGAYPLTEWTGFRLLLTEIHKLAEKG